MEKISIYNDRSEISEYILLKKDSVASPEDIFGEYHTSIISFLFRDVVYIREEYDCGSDPFGVCSGQLIYHTLYFIRGPLSGNFLIYYDGDGKCGHTETEEYYKGWETMVEYMICNKYRDALHTLKNMIYKHSNLFDDIGYRQHDYYAHKTITEKILKYKMYTSLIYMNYIGIPNEISVMILRNLI